MGNYDVFFWNKSQLLFLVSNTTSIWDGNSPAKLHHTMNSCRFEELNQNIKFTKHNFPSHRDKFHEVRELIADFNEHMKKVFIPSWISTLEESTLPWTRR